MKGGVRGAKVCRAGVQLRVVNGSATIYVPHSKGYQGVQDGLNTAGSIRRAEYMASLFRSMQWLVANTLAVLAGVILGATVAGGALAQGFDLRSLFSLPTTSSVVPPGAGTTDWSGESGASGH